MEMTERPEPAVSAKRCRATHVALMRGGTSWCRAVPLNSSEPIFDGGFRSRLSMAKLIYIANTSLDGYVEDGDGGIEWVPLTRSTSLPSTD